MRLVKDNGGTYLVHLLAVPCTSEQLGVSQKQFELKLNELSEMQKKQPIKSMAEIEEEKKSSGSSRV